MHWLRKASRCVPDTVSGCDSAIFVQIVHHYVAVRCLVCVSRNMCVFRSCVRAHACLAVEPRHNRRAGFCLEHSAGCLFCQFHLQMPLFIRLACWMLISRDRVCRVLSASPNTACTRAPTEDGESAFCLLCSRLLVYSTATLRIPVYADNTQRLAVMSIAFLVSSFVGRIFPGDRLMQKCRLPASICVRSCDLARSKEECCDSTVLERCDGGFGVASIFFCVSNCSSIHVKQ